MIYCWIVLSCSSFSYGLFNFPFNFNHLCASRSSRSENSTTTTNRGTQKKSIGKLLQGLETQNRNRKLRRLFKVHVMSNKNLQFRYLQLIFDSRRSPISISQASLTSQSMPCHHQSSRILKSQQNLLHLLCVFNRIVPIGAIVSRSLLWAQNVKCK